MSDIQYAVDPDPMPGCCPATISFGGQTCFDCKEKPEHLGHHRFADRDVLLTIDWFVPVDPAQRPIDPEGPKP